MAIGENLKRLRRDKGMTQGDLALMTGIRLNHVSKIERNESDPKLSTIHKLVNALECSANALLMDNPSVNMDAKLAAVFERANKLNERDKEIVLDVIDTYCMARGLGKLISEHGSFVTLAGKAEKVFDEGKQLGS